MVPYTVNPYTISKTCLLSQNLSIDVVLDDSRTSHGERVGESDFLARHGCWARIAHSWVKPSQFEGGGGELRRGGRGTGFRWLQVNIKKQQYNMQGGKKL